MNKELIEISKEESLILIDLNFPKITSNTDVGSSNIKSYELKNFDKNNTLKATLNLSFNIDGHLEEMVQAISNSREEIKKYQYNDILYEDLHFQIQNDCAKIMLVFL